MPATVIDQTLGPTAAPSKEERRRLHQPWGGLFEKERRPSSSHSINLACVPGSPADDEIGDAVRSTARDQTGRRLSLIKLLHRHDDGYISFAVKGEDGVQRPAFAIKGSALERALPGYVECLARNSLLSVNASYTLSRRDRNSEIGFPLHRSATLKYLCAAYCDIDHYRLGLTFYEALIQVHGMVASGRLPDPSLIVNSGHGMWLMWLLHDPDNPNLAHHGAWAQSEFDPLRIYSQVNQAICRCLKGIGSDPAATDGARYVRTPGSIRTDLGTAVWWSIQGSGEAGFSYTLWELADFFGVKCRRLLPEEGHAIAARRRVTGRQASGQRAAARQRLGAVLSLIAIRGGGFSKGSREAGIRHYAIALRYSGVSKGDAEARVLDVAADCHPPFPREEALRCVRSAFRSGTRRWRYTTFSRVLNITPEEAEIIAQRIGRPTFPAAGEQLQPLTTPTGRPKRREEAGARRAKIAELTEQVGGAVIPSRVMKSRLEALGFEASYVTILADYAALGFPVTRRVGWRKRADDHQAQIPLQEVVA